MKTCATSSFLFCFKFFLKDFLIFLKTDHLVILAEGLGFHPKVSQLVLLLSLPVPDGSSGFRHPASLHT